MQHAVELAGLTERLHADFEKLKVYLKPDVVEGLVRETDSGIYDVARYVSLANTVSDFDNLIRLDQLKEQLDGVNQTLIARCQAKAPMDQTLNAVEH
jgi:hypothetical protein